MSILISEERCDGCGICIESCPLDIFRLDDISKKAVPRYANDCHVCCLCEDDCPRDAIQLEYHIANARQKSVYDLLGIETPDIGSTDTLDEFRSE